VNRCFATALTAGPGLDRSLGSRISTINNLPPRRHPDQGRSDEHGELARGSVCRCSTIPLVEFACRLPARLRLRSGQNEAPPECALRGRVPARFLTRPKHGFACRWRSGWRNASPVLPGSSRRRPPACQCWDQARIGSEAIEAFAAVASDRDCYRLWALVVLGPSAWPLAEIGADDHDASREFFSSATR